VSRVLTAFQLIRRKFGAADLVAVIGLILLVAVPRLTNLNQYLIVDEADRWRWAKEFSLALEQGDLARTLVGDGYPGIVPVWLESIWIFGEAGRRSLSEGQWIGQPGLSHLLHEWDRTEYLSQQRLPIVLFNTGIALAIIWVVWRLFGRRVALVSGLLIALDPFYLSDSRVNRAEAVITGLMTLSILFLIFYYHQPRWRYVIISGLCGGLSFLTKIQALAILPIVAITALLIFLKDEGGRMRAEKLPPPLNWGRGVRVGILIFGGVWALAAAITWLLLWPSMWVTPQETLTLVYDYATRKVGSEGVNLFFLGQTYQDADPGLLFYPVVFFLRITPLVLLGLIGAGLRFTLYTVRPVFGLTRQPKLPADPFTVPGNSILVIYVLLYSLIMTVGSHKQDRYLMPIFPSLDILAALGLVYLWLWVSNKLLARLHPPVQKIIGGVALVGLIIAQFITVLPHHPYYYSYFNPIFGGGQTAVKSLRIGWGEGMDQVGAYLAAKPNSRDLVVSSRFTHNMLNFKGELIALGPDGRWTQADYIVLYIQQVQRRVDPSPEFIDYFMARPPEKVITIGGIDYAWIYPIPFSVPANPQISLIPGRAALLGYNWEPTQPTNQPTNQLTNQPTIRLLWQNLGLAVDQTLVARLTGVKGQSNWSLCRPEANFSQQAQTMAAYVESRCSPAIETLPPGAYSVEFGLAPANDLTAVELFTFPQGWDAVRITEAGTAQNTSARERLDALAQDAVPPIAVWLDRVYEGQIRLIAYRLEPAQPNPGDSLALTLYWQAVKDINQSAKLTVQLADSRSISLGRADELLHQFVRRGPDRFQWFPGQVKTTHHHFSLSPELESPLAGRIEVTLRNDAEVYLRPTTAAAEPLDDVVGRFTIAPERWPAPVDFEPVTARWQNGITLLGYTLTPDQPRAGEPLDVSLYWQTGQPIPEDYVVFVHLVNDEGQLQAQSDAIPRLGAYPTQWWLPDVAITDEHSMSLPPELPAGQFQLLVGLYRSADGVRLPLAAGNDSFPLSQVEVISFTGGASQ
jgi:hypothetical protein